MSEPFKIRVGSKSNKGTLKSENDDRILIGMDPSANDWLFSPDPVQVGEFGTVLLLADGLGDNENGGFAANSICKTIKKLFDETLELPPQDEEKLRLLVKFFQIAQKQLHTHSTEHHAYKNIGASATLVLLLENKAFIVWLGNCRAYRYNSKGVNNSFFTDLPELELLTVDHTYETEKALFDECRELKYYYPPGISKYISSEIPASEISASVISLKKQDRILICSEGLFTSLAEDDILEILASFDDPEITADELISRSFNNGSEKNISAIVTDILEVEPGIPLDDNSNLELIEKARLLYGVPMATEVLPAPPSESFAAPSKKEKPSAESEDLIPVKLRTVMPEPELNNESNEESPEIDDNKEPVPESSGQIALEWPVESHSSSINSLPGEDEIEESSEDEAEPEEEIDASASANEEPDPSFVSPVNPESPASQIQGEMAERLARLKIKMTVYPDPEDKEIEKKDNSETNTGRPYTLDESAGISTIISTDLDNEEDIEDNDAAEPTKNLEESDLIEQESEQQFYEEDDVEAENEKSIEFEEEEENEIEIPEPFESAIMPESEAFIINEDEDETEDETEDEDEVPEYEAEDPEDEPEKVLEGEEIELEPVMADSERFTTAIPAEYTPVQANQASVSVQKPIAHLIGSDQENKSAEVAEKKSKLWPYFAILGLLILIPIWICRDSSELNSDNNMDGASAAISIEEEKPAEPSTETIPATSIPDPESDQEPEIEEEDEAIIVNPPVASVPDPESEKPKEKKKEEAKPKTNSKEPKYDPDVEKNKHQLLGEVQALLQRKNQLCKQISTYGKNAPESKSESIKQIQNKCDQLGQKFSSIYDQKSGFFKTVRYDFMSGTIKSIRVSMDQIDKQFEAIRGE